jgi:hypothetical protein
MTKRESKSQTTWTDVKAKLAAFDRTALVDLLHHLYSAHQDNQAFLHARFGLGENVLEPYKKIIDRWLSGIKRRDLSMPWSACSSKPSSRPTLYPRTAGPA